MREVGLYPQNLPIIQLSDRVESKCCILCVFPEEYGIPDVSVGERVTVRANYLGYSFSFGIVMKLSELIRP